jgi:enamine deaminase RidA (YjgF/YER057c/UK114 family)
VAKGWGAVYRVNSYHTKTNDDPNVDPVALKAMVDNFKKWCPDHHPIWTMVGVTQLGEPQMLVEIEVVAYDV